MDATMTQGATVQLRVNAQTKVRSFDVFKRHGLTLTDGIRVYLERVATTNEIPFTLNIPNEETRQVILDMEAGLGVTKYENKEDMYSHLRSLAKQHA